MTKRLMLAVDAVRGTTSGEESGAACYTRARVLGAVRQRERRRVLNVAFGIPLAAVLMGSVAWAATGQHLTAVVRYVSSVITQDRPEHRVRTPSKLGHPKSNRVEPSTPAPAESSVAPESLAAPEPASADSSPAASPRASSSTTGGVPRTGAPRDDALTERELLLYDSAHRAHFTDKEWAAALAAWERYLRELPRGRFAIEASYNRALCLLRLGRTDEGVGALRPFAQGAFGSYRQREAQTLVERFEPSAR